MLLVPIQRLFLFCLLQRHCCVQCKLTGLQRPFCRENVKPKVCVYTDISRFLWAIRKEKEIFGACLIIFAVFLILSFFSFVSSFFSRLFFSFPFPRVINLKDVQLLFRRISPLQRKNSRNLRQIISLMDDSVFLKNFYFKTIHFYFAIFGFT